MKKAIFLAVGLIFASSFAFTKAYAESKNFKASGEVVGVDSIYNHLTVKHNLIKGFAAPGQTEFTPKSNESLKNLEVRDLIEFEITADKNNVTIDKITKVGQAPQIDDSLSVGQVVQEALVGTGNVARGITAPIQPANEVVSDAVAGTTEATGSALENLGPKTKNKF